MRLLAMFAALLLWPFVVVQSLRARRRLRAYAAPGDTRPFTLERVA